MLGYDITNIKVSCKIYGDNVGGHLREKAKTNENVHKQYGNFFVLRQEFVYIIFYTGHVNCTKLKTDRDVFKAKEVLENFLGSKFYVSKLRVDNISACGDFAKLSTAEFADTFNLLLFKKYLQRIIVPNRFNPQSFPGLNFKVGRATFVVFTSGKFICVGSDSFSGLSIAVNLFTKHIRAFWNDAVSIKRDEDRERVSTSC